MEERIDILLARQLSGEATAEELQELQQWMKERPGTRFVTEVLNATSSTEVNNSQEWAAGGWAALEQKMKAPGAQLPLTPVPRAAVRRFPRWTVAAACIAVAGLAAAFLFRSEPRKALIAKTASNTITMRKGARSSVQLPDGTTVWLNSSSNLTYGDGFAQGNREVFLQGEAFFTVAANEQRPFIVHAGNLTVRVLGTSFNVKAYAGDDNEEVVLLSGKVAVFTARRPEALTLVPGQKALAWAATAADSLQALAPEIVPFHLDKGSNTCDETAWTRNQLVFRNKTFLLLAKDMERWYNVNIHIQDASLKNELFNGAFQKENVTEALKALQIATPFTFYQSGSEIYIKKAG